MKRLDVSHIITALVAAVMNPVNPTDDESFRHCIFRRGVYVQTRAVADGAVICYRYGNGDAAWNPYKIRWCTPGNCDHNQATGIKEEDHHAVSNGCDLWNTDLYCRVCLLGRIKWAGQNKYVADAAHFFIRRNCGFLYGFCL